jgi:AcrR family transcriptional regulator
VLAATLDVLASAGLDGLTIAAVAERSGVHETSVYRRWGTRERLALDALTDFSSELVPMPDKGSLRADLVALGRSVRAYAASPLGAALMQLMATPSADDDVRHVHAQFWLTRYGANRILVERAVERGELPANIDPQILLEAFIAPVHFRLLQTRQPVTDRYLETLADLVVRGLAA